MLLEEHALVRHVLVDDPQPFAVHCHDETRAHLPEWLEVRDLFGARKAGGSVCARRGKIRRPIPRGGSLHWCDTSAKCGYRSEWNPLLNRPHWRSGEIKSAIRAHARAEADLFHRRND